ncbi:hypothetical protein K435DRAFT_688673, partial [Dendrothele bispora CBS 962.96]
TKHFSKSNSTLIADIPPIMDALTKKIFNIINDPITKPIIKAAAAKAYTILNKYYGKTDSSIMYRICMMLHPKYKLTYFEKEDWPSE